MNAVPRTYPEGQLRLVASSPEYSILECEVSSPKSSMGRTVYVFLSATEQELLLRELRDKAIQRRSQPLDG